MSNQPQRTTTDANGYSPLSHDPAHKRWIGCGFCVKCGGYACTTPETADVAALETRVEERERALEIARADLEDARKQRKGAWA